MDKKVTRRAVLGTVLAGLVASPFAIRHLRSRNEGVFSSHDEDWVSALRRFEVIYGSYSGPETFDLPFDPCVNTGIKAEFLNSNGQCGRGIPSETVTASWFSHASGTIAPREYGGKTVFQITANPSSIAFQSAPNESASGGSFSIVTREGFFDHLILSDGSVKNVNDIMGHPMSLPPASHDYLSVFVFDIPERSNLRVGSKWTIPAGGLYQYDFPCEIVGLLTVSGRSAVRILSRVVQETFRNNPMLEILPETEEYAEIRKALENSGIRENVVVNTFVDMETGLVMRRESQGKSETRIQGGAIDVAYGLHIAQLTILN